MIRSFAAAIGRTISRFGLRTRLLFLVVATMLPLVCLVLALIEGVRQDQTAAAVERARLLAIHGARVQTDVVRSTRGVLEVLSLIPAVKNAEPAACAMQLRDTLPQFPFLSGLSVVSPRGDVLCDNTSLQPVNVGDRPYFRSALANGEFTLSDYLIGRISGKPTLIALLPVLDDWGEVAFLMLASIDLGWLRLQLQHLVSDDQGDTLLVDGAGMVLATGVSFGNAKRGQSFAGHPMVRSMLSAPDGAFLGAGFDGDVRITGFARLGYGSGVLVVSLRQDALAEMLDHRRNLSLMVLGLLFLGSVAAAWVLIEVYVLGTVRALQVSALRLARGDLASRPTDTSPAGPLSDLAHSIDAMGRTLSALAYQDRLTELPNRLYLERWIERTMNAPTGHPGCALLFIDLDGFKAVNDHFGHAVGDEVLRQVSKRLLAAVRELDTVVRLGGDEFVVLVELSGGYDSDRPQTVAERILGAVAEPMIWSGERLHIGCSIGIAQWPDHASSLAEIVSRADEALYAAKKAGKGRIVHYGELAANVADSGSQ